MADTWPRMQRAELPPQRPHRKVHGLPREMEKDLLSHRTGWAAGRRSSAYTDPQGAPGHVIADSRPRALLMSEGLSRWFVASGVMT